MRCTTTRDDQSNEERSNDYGRCLQTARTEHIPGLYDYLKLLHVAKMFISVCSQLTACSIRSVTLLGFLTNDAADVRCTTSRSRSPLLNPSPLI